MYRVEIWNRRTQRWEPAEWAGTHPYALAASHARREAVERSLTTYGDSRVSPIGNRLDVTT